MGVDDDSATRLGPAASVGTAASASSFDDGGFTPGTVLQSRYRIVGLIGRGGMGEVYRAQDLKLGQSVALKFLPEDVGRDPARLERFLSEVRIARQISHPNVCRVYDVGEIDGRHFLSMEFVDGEDLASLLRRIGRLPADKGVEIARQVCAGLSAAHDRGVLHRDLKPANIMIDGRGHARLADFGLAAAGVDLRPGEVAGTPAYMAPEQLEGRELSTRSDIYALGLVLHEVFTGKRVFDAASVHALREQHRSRAGSHSTLPSPSADVDPAIDRVIRRCLEPDPARRPPSALAVAAALPGGDPLAAALAAGETPSPELVAQAGTEGALSLAASAALLALVVAGVLATASLGDRIRVNRLLTAMRSPEVLAARAEDLLDSLGYRARGDSVYGVRRNTYLVNYVTQDDQRRDRWERLVETDAPAVQFWYRQSPAPLVPFDEINRASFDDPPLRVPGMAQVELSPRGRLVSFRAVPTELSQTPPANQSADWSPLFKAAGVDPNTITPVTEVRTPPVYADTLAAWEGRYPGYPEWTMRVEAGSHRGQPVWFVVAGPWEHSFGTDPRQPPPRDPFARIGPPLQASVQILGLIAGGLLALRNTRAGRTDRRGATIVAVCAGASLLASLVVGNHYAGSIWVVWQRLLVQIALVLFWATLIWLQYLALEPFARRRWPEAMISWTRLLGGRFADALVARHILIGCVGGFAIIIFGDIFNVLPEMRGEPPRTPQIAGSIMRSLGPVELFVAEIARRPSRVLLDSVLMLFLIMVANALLRKWWLAMIAVMMVYGVILYDRAAVLLSIVGPVVFVGVLVTLVSRFGVLSYVAAWFVIFAVFDLPLSLNQSAWFATRSAITAAMILGIAGWAFYRGLGSRPALGTAFD